MARDNSATITGTVRYVSSRLRDTPNIITCITRGDLPLVWADWFKAGGDLGVQFDLGSDVSVGFCLNSHLDVRCNGGIFDFSNIVSVRVHDENMTPPTGIQS